MFLDDQYLAAASKPQSSPRGAGPRDIGAAGRDRTMHGMWATRSNHQDPSGVACGLGRFSVSVRCAQKFARAARRAAGEATHRRRQRDPRNWM